MREVWLTLYGAVAPAVPVTECVCCDPYRGRFAIPERLLAKPLCAGHRLAVTEYVWRYGFPPRTGPDGRDSEQIVNDEWASLGLERPRRRGSRWLKTVRKWMLPGGTEEDLFTLPSAGQ